MTAVVHDAVEQGTEAWTQIRLGIPTASMFHAILAKGEGKTRRSYMLRLAGERLTGEPTETYTNGFMDRGREMEDEARRRYAFVHDVEPTRVGFILNGNVGCSPDSLIGDRGGLEIKTKRSDLQIDCLLRDELPPEHKAQVQGCLWVADREFWDFVSYWPGLPLFVKRVPRDNGYIANLAGAVAAFNEELAETVERVRSYGREPDRAAA